MCTHLPYRPKHPCCFSLPPLADMWAPQVSFSFNLQPSSTTQQPVSTMPRLLDGALPCCRWWPAPSSPPIPPPLPCSCSSSGQRRVRPPLRPGARRARLPSAAGPGRPMTFAPGGGQGTGPRSGGQRRARLDGGPAGAAAPRSRRCGEQSSREKGGRVEELTGDPFWGSKGDEGRPKVLVSIGRSSSGSNGGWWYLQHPAVPAALRGPPPGPASLVPPNPIHQANNLWRPSLPLYSNREASSSSPISKSEQAATHP
jgi:hypothetical protein